MTPDELRTRRLALGLSLAQLAAALGTYRGQIANWEQGRRRMSLSGAVDLALWALEHGAPRPAPGRRGPKKIPENSSETA